MAKLTSNLQYTDTFNAWFTKTNQILEDERTVIVTVADVAQPNTTNGAWTSGNAHVEGVFSANTLVVTDVLRGGTTSNSDTLTVNSSLIIEGTLLRVDGDISMPATSSKVIKTVSANTTYQPISLKLENSSGTLDLVDFTSIAFSKSDANNDISLGRLSIPWNHVYAIDGTLTGNVDISGELTVGANLAVTEQINANNIIIDTDARVNGDMFVGGALSIPANIVFEVAQSEITDLTVITSLDMFLGARVISDFIPDANTDDYALGSSSERWAELYVNTIDAAGNITTTQNLVGKINWNDIVYNKPELYTRTEADARYVNVTGDTMTGSLITTGVLTNSLSVNNNIVTLNSGVTGAPALNASIVVERGTANNSSFFWDETVDTWKINNAGSSYGVVGSISQGSGVAVTRSGDSPVVTVAHASTSTVDPIPYGGNGLSSITVDPFGHITDIKALNVVASTGLSIDKSVTNQLTFTNTDRGSSQNIFKNITAISSGGSNVGTITADNNNDTAEFQVQGPLNISVSVGGDKIIIGHNTTPARTSTNTNGTVIQSLSLDSYGHITSISSANLDGRFALRSTSISSGAGLTGGGDLTTNRTISHGDTSNLNGSYGGNNNGVVVESVSVDGYGHLTGVGTRNFDDRYLSRVADTGTAGYVAAAGGFIFGHTQRGNHLENDGAFYRYAGQAYLTVDDNFYIRDVGSSIKFYFDTNGGSFTATGNIAAFSDEKLKSNVRTVDGALELVSKMRGVRYEKDGREEVGVIAQEIEKILPEVVSEVKMEDDTYKTVAYGNIVGVLIEAIKELRAEIEELKGK